MLLVLKLLIIQGIHFFSVDSKSLITNKTGITLEPVGCRTGRLITCHVNYAARPQLITITSLKLWLHAMFLFGTTVEIRIAILFSVNPFILKNEDTLVLFSHLILSHGQAAIHPVSLNLMLFFDVALNSPKYQWKKWAKIIREISNCKL